MTEFIFTLVILTALLCGKALAQMAKLNVQLDDKGQSITTIGWDTEGGERAKTNLLRTGETIHLRSKGSDSTSGLSIRSDASSLTLSVNTKDETSELVMPFDPKVAATTILPAKWNDDGSFNLPAILSAPDFGQMQLTSKSGQPIRGRLEGSRDERRIDVILEIPSSPTGQSIELSLDPFVLDPPAGLIDKSLWPAVRRGWMNEFQCTARWGDPKNPTSSPPGLFANNVLSDPASCSIWFYADQMLWTPSLTKDISIAAIVRRTLEFWLDHRIKPDGEMICYWAYGGFLDANAGPIIAAWDYVEATGDVDWLKAKPPTTHAMRIDQLEFIADYLIQRDIEGDGLVEAKQTGNRGSLVEPNRSCAWWDALNCGHKDAYTNALIFRAWKCLADLERKLGRADKANKYSAIADKLKSNYAKELLDPKTGWLGWWRSADGELHDYDSPTTNGLAIEYGLIEPAQGKEILAKLRQRMKDVGFKRFDLGVPPMLTPVKPYDYLLPTAIGAPKLADGTDTFGIYMNGGITAGHVLDFLAAHYVVGDPAPADEILRAMIGRQQLGEFQNAVANEANKGIDWTTWDGKPAGYEGYLADNFRFLQAVLLREKSFRDRFYRPMRE